MKKLKAFDCVAANYYCEGSYTSIFWFHCPCHYKCFRFTFAEL